MDPNQRLVLEVAYEALHGAGARRASLLGDDAGVFLGIERPDWALLQALAPGPRSVYAATGDNLAVAAGRLSFNPRSENPVFTGLMDYCRIYATGSVGAAAGTALGSRLMCMN